MSLDRNEVGTLHGVDLNVTDRHRANQKEAKMC